MLNIWYPRDTKTPQGGPPSCITRVVSQLRSIQNVCNFAGYISNAFPSKKIYVPNFVVCWFIFSLQRNMYMVQWCRSHLLLGLKWLYWVRRILCSGRGCLKPPLSTKHNILNTCILDYKKVIHQACSWWRFHMVLVRQFHQPLAGNDYSTDYLQICYRLTSIRPSKD